MKRTELRRTTPLSRGKGLNPMGEKALRDRMEMKRVRPEVLARGCEFRTYLEEFPHIGAALPEYVPITCAGALHAHHAVRKSQGGTNRGSNLICLCRRHHDWVHGQPEASFEMGLLR